MEQIIITNTNSFFRDLENSLNFLISPQIQEKLLSLKIIFILISVFFIICIIYFLKKSSYLSVNSDLLSDFGSYKRQIAISKYQKKWEKIKMMLFSETEEGRKIALIEAEKFFDLVLSKIGYKNKSVEEKIKEIGLPEDIDVEKILWAHQVCQDIIHDPDYKLEKEEAKKVIDVFEQTFYSLNIF